MYCKHCGAKVDESAAFCSACGNQIISSQTKHDTTDGVPMTIEEVIADFSGDKHGAAKYLSLRDGITIADAKKQVEQADYTTVHQLITQKRIDDLSHCPECGSDNVTVSKETYVETVSRSFIWNLFMTVITAGIWLIWMLVRGKKENIIETKTAVCQKCGHSWELDY